MNVIKDIFNITEASKILSKIIPENGIIKIIIDYENELYNKEILNIKDWYKISKISNLRMSFVEKYRKNLHWVLVSENYKLTDIFFQRFKDSLIPEYLSFNPYLTEYIIREVAKELNWYHICSSNIGVLTKDIIMEFGEYIEWYDSYNHLSYDFEYNNEGIVNKYPHLIDDDIYKAHSHKFIDFYTEKELKKLLVNVSKELIVL